MFFAHMVLRPAAAETLDPPQRLKLMDAVFRRFFVWVWGAVGAILATGFFPDLPVRRLRPPGNPCPHYADFGASDGGNLRLCVFCLLQTIQHSCGRTALERSGRNTRQDTQADRAESGAGAADRVRGGDWRGVGLMLDMLATAIIEMS